MRVVVRVGHQVDDLLPGGPARLACLRLQQVHQEFAILDDQVAVSPDHRNPLRKRAGRPNHAGRRALERVRHVGGIPDRDGGQRQAGEHLVDGSGRAGGDIGDRGRRSRSRRRQTEWAWGHLGSKGLSHQTIHRQGRAC